MGKMQHTDVFLSVKRTWISVGSPVKRSVRKLQFSYMKSAAGSYFRSKGGVIKSSYDFQFVVFRTDATLIHRSRRLSVYSHRQGKAESDFQIPLLQFLRWVPLNDGMTQKGLRESQITTGRDWKFTAFLFSSKSSLSAKQKRANWTSLYWYTRQVNVT